MDVGCGNGYTLEVLATEYPDHSYVGIEKSPELRSLAASRFQSSNNVKIFEGDIRDEDFTKGIIADNLICQEALFIPPTFLSTHYYISRVFGAFLSRDKPLQRNSEFVRFFSNALNQSAGDYSPLKLYMFEKV